MNQLTRRLPLYVLLLSLTQCSKCKNAPTPTDPASQLPPATQTGANTFGCLVNGQPWTPQGNDGTSNYEVSYSMLPTGGLLEIGTYRIYGPGATDFQSLALWVNQLSGVGTYSFQNQQTTIATFSDRKTNCFWRSRDAATTYRRGSMTITRLDRQAGIVSGTFAFTLYVPGCDSIRISEGRFDRKL